MRVEMFDVPTWSRGRPTSPARLRLSPGIAEATAAALRAAASVTGEGLVLWAGRPDECGSTLVSHLIVPDIEADDDWLRVSTASRLEVLRTLREADLLVVADVHSHPRTAFLSDVDRRHPYSAREGHVAIVVPDFGSGAVGAGWRTYEATGGRWVERELAEVVDGWGV